jgi:diguanylate cyclase (GGDEF)-like protein
VSDGLWAAVAAGFLLGLVLGGLIRARRRRADVRIAEDRAPNLPDVADIMRQLLSASGRRAMVPVILTLLEELLEPEQAAVFVNRPDRKLALADGIGLPESLSRGAELEPGHGRVGRVAQTRRAMSDADFQGEPDGAGAREPAVLAGLRVDIAAPILAGPRLHGVICVGGARRRREEAKALVKMVADLSGLAIVQVEKLKAIQDTANIDGLTGVFNKRHFQERISSEIRRAERDGNGLSLLLLDIDHFKNYNDTNGHVAGDEVLKKMGQILKTSVREDDVVARYGGEEFVVLYPGASKALAYRLAQGLRRAVESQHFPGGERQPLGAVTISGGVATFPLDAPSEVELIRAADQALYQAKKAGRNRIIGAGASDPALGGRH